jgi:hypothetical protein
MIALLWSTVAWGDDAAVRAVLAHFGHEPGIREVQAWVAEGLSVDTDVGERLARHSRIAAAFPSIDIDVRQKSGWNMGWEFVPTDGVVDRPEEALYHVLEDAKEDRDFYVAVGASWDLGDLWMSADRLRVWNEQQAVAKVRRDTLVEATEVYFERRRLQVEAAAPTLALAKAADLEVRIAQYTALLDAFTGGRFGEALAAEAHRLDAAR